MAKGWHREEPREVRPFFAASAVASSLDASAIRLYPGGLLETERSFDLDEIDFQRLSISVFPKVAEPSQWSASDVGPDDLEVLLIATQTFLKRSKVLYRVPVKDAPHVKQWDVEASDLARLAGGRNLELTLALTLTQDRLAVPGSPFVVGHWLAKKSFMLRSRSMPTLFDLRTRSDEDWVAAKFPAKTLFSVDYAGGISEESDENTSVATVYIHIDAHNKLVNSNFAESYQAFLSVEIILSILTESFGEWKDLHVVHSGSPLATLLAQLSKEGGMTLRELQEAVAKPAYARAILQDRLSLVRTLK